MVYMRLIINGTIYEVGYYMFHPKDTIIVPFYARSGDKGIGVGILKLSRL